MIPGQNGVDKPILYSYWRSSAAWRVRIVLALKGIEYQYQPVNLLKGEQLGEEYKKIHPGGLVPALKISDGNYSTIITQSLAIIDYLESMVPDKAPLLPKDQLIRAKVLELVYTLACDTHPLQNLRVLHTYPEGEQRSARAKQVISHGLKTFETLLSSIPSGKYCLGDEISLADVVLVPQIYNAIRWECDLTPFPRCQAIYENLNKLSPFIAAHPTNQPDTPKQ